MHPKRGEVVLVLYPDSNLRTAKRQPALVVQADGLATGLPQTVIAMITSNLSRGGHPSRVRVDVATPDGRASGLRTDSIVATDNLTTVLHSEIDRVIGALPGMGAVDAALRRTLGL